MTNFKVGQKVVCVDDNFQPRYEWVTYPTKNEMYTIRNISKKGGLRFEEIINPKYDYEEGYHEHGFFYWRFRKPDHQFAEDVIAMICSQP